MPGQTLQIGIAGAGGFAHFAAKAFIKVPGIEIVAIVDINETASQQMAAEFNAEKYVNYEALLKDSTH
jgi:predicted dehydrogenase